MMVSGLEMVPLISVAEAVAADARTTVRKVVHPIATLRTISSLLDSIRALRNSGARIDNT